MKKLRSFCHGAWMEIVRALIAFLEIDLRGRILDWLYSHMEEDITQIYYDRWYRPGGRYYRKPR